MQHKVACIGSYGTSKVGARNILVWPKKKLLQHQFSRTFSSHVIILQDFTKSTNLIKTTVRLFSTLMFAGFHDQSPLTINYACNNELQKKFIVTDFKIKNVSDVTLTYRWKFSNSIVIHPEFLKVNQIPHHCWLEHN